MEDSYEERERVVFECGQEERRGRDTGALDWKWRNDGAGGAEFSDRRPAREAGGNGAKQVLLQHQSAAPRAASAAQTIEREIDGGEEGDRGDGERVRISVQPGRRVAGGIGGVGGGGKQVLPIF